MATPATFFEITNGPSKFNLMLALFTEETRVSFFAGEVQAFEVMVTSLERQPFKSCDDWVVRGVVIDAFDPMARVRADSHKLRAKSFQCDFSSQTRKGSLWCSVPSEQTPALKSPDIFRDDPHHRVG